MKNKYFTEQERYKLEAFLQAKMKVKDIAKLLDKCENTIRNEIRRGSVELLDTSLKPYMKYCADVGQRKYNENKIKKGCKPKASNNFALVDYVSYLISVKKYSPYVCSILLRCRPDLNCTLCEKSIYNYVKSGYIPNVTGKSLAYKKENRKKDKIVTIPLHNAAKPLITDRDKSVALRASFGHWEMDTVYSGKDKSKACLLVLTERKSRQEIIKKIPDRTALSVTRALDDLEKAYGKRNFKKLFKTITCDNGSEFADYEGITRNGRTKLYYCHPYKSCERGSNENANKLIRRWIPKGTDISKLTDEDVEYIEYWINNLPRKIFGGLSSIEFMKHAQETA